MSVKLEYSDSGLTYLIFNKLSSLLSKSIPAEFFNDEIVWCYYDLFITDILDTYARKYSEVDFLDHLEYYVNNSLHLSKEYSTIYTEFVKVIESRYSETHNDIGVKEIKFIGDFHMPLTKILVDSKVLYKNYLGLDTVLKEILSVLTNFSKYFPNFELDSNNYISREFVEVDKILVDFEKYYFNLGYAISFLLAFRAIDLNIENVLVSNNLPCFFDIEFLFTPLFKTVLKKYNISISSLLNDTNLDDISAMNPGKTVRTFTRPYVYLKKEDIEIKWENNFNKSRSNLPENFSLHNSSDFLQNILDGFDAGVLYILENRDLILEILPKLDGFTRTILKPTSVYKYAILSSIYSELSPSNTIKNTLLEFGSYDPHILYEEKLIHD